MDLGEIDFIDTDDENLSTVAPEESGTKTEIKDVGDGSSLDDEIVDFGELNVEDVDNEDEIIDTPENTEGTEPGDSSSPDKSLYLNLAKALSEKGVINDFEGSIFEEDGAEGTEVLMGLLQSTVTDSIDEYKSQFTEDTVKLMNAIEKGLPIDGFLKEKTKEINYNSITSESLESDDSSGVREKILKDFYKSTTSFSDSRIDREIKRMIDLGEDTEESVNALTKLKEIYKDNADQALATKEAERVSSQEKFDKGMESLRKEIDEIDLSFLGGKANKKSRDRYFNILTKPVETVDGRGINAIAKKRNEIGGERFDIILAALMDKGVFDGDLSKLSSKQRKNAIEELQRSVEANEDSIRSGGSNTHRTYDSSADSIFERQR